MTKMFGAALSAGLFLSAAQARAADLVVNVTDIRDAMGSIQICLWSAPGEGFPDCNTRKPFRLERLPAKAGIVSFRLADVPAGTYAVSAFHDEKNTGKLPQDFLGRPQEGVGTSNNAQGFMSAPSFKSAAFATTGAGGQVTFKITYP